jgi:hypothetical protein
MTSTAPAGWPAPTALRAAPSPGIDRASAERVTTWFLAAPGVAADSDTTAETPARMAGTSTVTSTLLDTLRTRARNSSPSPPQPRRRVPAAVMADPLHELRPTRRAPGAVGAVEKGTIPHE